VATLFSGITVERVKNYNPRQYLTIGFVEGQLMTLISEEQQNEEGHFLWLVTYWPSTRREREIYEEET
jgi:hypothetical protein